MLNNLTKSFFSSALFLVGAATLAMPSGYSLGFYLITFVSLGLWFKTRENLLPTDARYFLWPLLTYGVGYCLLSITESFAFRDVDPYIPFVFSLFGFWGLRKYKPNGDWFWLGLAVGAILAAFISGYQSIKLGMRAGGFGNHPIQFGNIALLFGMLCLVRLISDWRWTRLNIVLVAGALAGMAASVFSQTRGGWVALLLILIWIFTQATDKWPRQKKLRLIAVLGIALALPVLQPNGIVQQRVGVAVKEWNSYFETGNQDTSVGARLAMWKIGLKGIAQAPWFGQGNQGWLDARNAALTSGELSAFSAEITHLHNEYLNVAFKRGLVGLVLYLGLYFVPMLYFFKRYLRDDRSQVKTLAMAGMVVPLMYMDFALTQSFLTHNSGRVVLCSLWMCISSLLLNSTEEPVCE